MRSLLMTLAAALALLIVAGPDLQAAGPKGGTGRHPSAKAGPHASGAGKVHVRKGQSHGDKGTVRPRGTKAPGRQHASKDRRDPKKHHGKKHHRKKHHGRRPTDMDREENGSGDSGGGEVGGGGGVTGGGVTGGAGGSPPDDGDVSGSRPVDDDPGADDPNDDSDDDPAGAP